MMCDPLTAPNHLDTLVASTLQGRYVWAAGTGWSKHDGTRWKRVSHVHVIETVRLAVKALYDTAATDGTDADQLRELERLLYVRRVSSIASLATRICEVDTTTTIERGA